MFNTLPATAQEFMGWSWAQMTPYVQDLEARELTEATVDTWMRDWTKLANLVGESVSRLNIATTLDTSDTDATDRFHAYLQDIIEPVTVADNRLKEKLLASGLQPENFEIPLRNMHTEAELFCEANVPLFTQENHLTTQFNQIIGKQTVEWQGEEKAMPQMNPIFQSDDRAEREKAWRLISERVLADRQALNDLWQQYMPLRKQMAANAGFTDYRAYRWLDFKRFDYSPADCETFHKAIEQYVVPAATRVYERQRQKLGVDTLRPWDLGASGIYMSPRPPLVPYSNPDDFAGKALGIFQTLDPELGAFFKLMMDEGLLDLFSRKNKAPGGYQATLANVKRPFIFMNAAGVHDDVQTLLHEAGHAFHALESAVQPYRQQIDYGAEIAEVASMSMELLAGAYLSEERGGYYSQADANRAFVEHLEHLLLFWPYMAVVDAFQHWVYTNDVAATDPANCDAKWDELWGRFMPGIDYSGLEDSRMTGWHRKLHIFQIPFYYVDYGLAQVGAVQVWRNSLTDEKQAVQQYRAMLRLGGTRSLPKLFEAAGVKFAFDGETMRELVELLEGQIAKLGH